MFIRALKANPSFPLAQDAIFKGCWEYELQSGENTDTHVHPEGQEIHLILQGRGLITVGDVTREVTEREVIVVPAQIPHCMQNPFDPPLRGLSVEASLPLLISKDRGEERVTLRDLEEVIESIPKEVDTPEALQLIIRLFDLAGFLSEQVEQAIGLDTEMGLNAIAAIEQQVMAAVVLISQNYKGGYSSRFPRRF